MATAATRHGIVSVLPKFDRRSGLAYSLIAFAFIAQFGLGRMQGFHITSVKLVASLECGAVLIFVSSMLRRAGRVRIPTLIETVVLTYLQGLIALLLLVVVTPLSLPMADDLLASMDRTIGFSWPSAVQAMSGAPMRVALAAYDSFLWQALGILALLSFTGQDGRAWRMVTAATIALLITVPIYMLMPADGAAIHFGFRAIPGLHSPGPWEFSPVIHALKGGQREVGDAMLAGLVSMPSYHAASAAIFAWGAWRTPLRWPVLALNVAMALAAIPVGAHYLVDIIGGVIVGAAGIWLASLYCLHND